MKLLTKQIQQHFNGFLQTPSLWNGNQVFDLLQFEINQRYTAINLKIDQKLRLGKYIERFVSFQLQQENNIEIISENIQIQQNKITLGELDCLLLKSKSPIHLEIVYKFYLYDETVGGNEIEHFIGPNRKDSLIEKLIKLKEKQLPILYSNECKTYLKTLTLKVSEIEQQIYFKAQLFVPFTNRHLKLSTLNPNCVVGFYINQQEIHQFTSCKFYFPIKKDWLVIPHSNVNWISFENLKSVICPFLERKFSPMCWIKKTNGEIFKIFVVWW